MDRWIDGQMDRWVDRQLVYKLYSQIYIKTISNSVFSNTPCALVKYFVTLPMPGLMHYHELPKINFYEDILTNTPYV